MTLIDKYRRWPAICMANVLVISSVLEFPLTERVDNIFDPNNLIQTTKIKLASWANEAISVMKVDKLEIPGVAISLCLSTGFFLE